jgi:hypothetical protein
MVMMLPIAAIAVSCFALGYGVRALVSAQRKQRARMHAHN